MPFSFAPGPTPIEIAGPAFAGKLLFSAGRSISAGADISLTPEVTDQSGPSGARRGHTGRMSDRWNALPDRPKPEDWVAEKDTNPPLPGSLAEAEADREAREVRTVFERGGGV